MLFDYLYKENSAGDLGTLYQLKARLNRKDVQAKVNKSYHGTEAFFHTVVDGYVVYAAMEFFGTTSADAKPTLHMAQANDSHTLKEKVGELVNKYVLFKPELDNPQLSMKKFERQKHAKNAMFADFLLVTRSMYIKSDVTTMRFQHMG